MASGADSRVEFYLRLPGKGSRRSFALIRRHRGAGGRKSKAETVRHEPLEAINRQFRDGTLPYDQAHEAARRELEALKKKHAPKTRVVTLRGANLRWFNQYWDQNYAHRPLLNVKAARSRLRIAVEALGDTPLTAGRDELQKAVNESAGKNARKQRLIVSALNQILRWMGRHDVKLTRMRKQRPKVRYITLEEMDSLVANLTDEHDRILAWVAFATGCRAGEIFALTDRKFRKTKRTVFVDEQVTEAGEKRDPKNGKAREVPVLPEGLPWLEKWIKVGTDDRRELRKRRLGEIMTRACVRAWPDEPEKHLVFHDLRHSYAIHLLNKGVHTGLVAQALGDSIVVVEEHYTGFALTTPGLDAIAKVLDR